MLTFAQYLSEQHEHGDFVRDDHGKPIPYFHGTRNAFDEFKPNVKKNMQLGFGIHFTPHSDKAAFYTQKGTSKGNQPNIHKVHLRAKNILDTDQMYQKDTHPHHFALHQELHKGTGRQPYVSSEGHFVVNPDVTNPARAAKLIQKHGFDAVKYQAIHPGFAGGQMVKKDKYPAIAVFHPGQIHSAFHSVTEATEPEHEHCESCDKKHHPDNMRDIVHEHGVAKRCLNCVRDSDDLRHCARCERLHYSSHDSEHCPECEKKDTRHEVRYYNHPDGGDKQHAYFNSSAKAHNFAKNNSYNYGNSSVYHKGEHQKSYWQGK